MSKANVNTQTKNPPLPQLKEPTMNWSTRNLSTDLHKRMVVLSESRGMKMYALMNAALKIGLHEIEQGEGKKEVEE